VTRGLLSLTANEDELAAVVGHEIIHAAHRHTARQLAKARTPILPGAVVGSVVSENLGNLINPPVALAGGAYLASKSRQDEFESDHFGQQLAATTGYDPAGMVPVLNRLEAYEVLHTGEKRIPSFFETHPMTPNRVQRVQRGAQKIPWTRKPGIAPDGNT
jgi:predicted Zn-dependent protease